jgi:hypothetical protein
VSPFELDRHVHRDLRRLPAPKAPAALLPRILAARAKVDRRPWYRRSWSAWPLGWRVASAATSAAVGAAVSWAMAAFYPELAGWMAAAIDRTAVRFAPGFREGFVTVEVVWRALVLPIGWFLIGPLVMMWAACAAVGVALTRIASGEVSRS